MTAFYFRQHGNRRDGERTFEFTHKSFGEYLIACRIVRALDVILEETDRRQRNVDRGWSERDALRHWLTVCGSAPLDTYLATFVRNEIALRVAEAASWQSILERLLSYALANGLPIELLDSRPRFVDEQRLARNAEEALLVVLNAAARVTQRMSHVTWPEQTAAGQWISRLQGQRQGPINGLTLRSLSYMDFSRCILDLRDFYGADLRHSSFKGAEINYCNLMQANASGADFEDARAFGTFFDEADLSGCNFALASLGEARFTNANLRDATMDGARVTRRAAKAWIRRGVTALTDEEDIHGNVSLSGIVTRGPKASSQGSIIEDAG